MLKIAFPLVLALAVVASPASAESGKIEIRVETAGLDLGSSEGRSALQARLDNAVRLACSPVRKSGVRGWARYRACVAQKSYEANQDRDALLARVNAGTEVASLR